MAVGCQQQNLPLLSLERALKENFTLNLTHPARKEVNIITPVLQTGRLRNRGIQWFAQDPFHSLYLIGHFPLILKPIHPLENIWANEKTCSASTTDTLGNQCSIVHRACSCSNWIELPNSYLFQLGAGAGPVLVQFLSVNSPKVFKYRMAAWVWTVYPLPVGFCRALL